MSVDAFGETLSISSPLLWGDENNPHDDPETAMLGVCGFNGGSSGGAYENIIINDLEPGRYRVQTHGIYYSVNQFDEHIIVESSSGDSMMIPDLDGPGLDDALPWADQWLWGEAQVDVCDSNGEGMVMAMVVVVVAKVVVLTSACLWLRCVPCASVCFLSGLWYIVMRNPE